MFTAGACGSGLTNSLELPDDDFLLEGDNNDSAFCTVGVRDVVSTANLEFPDGESPEFLRAEYLLMFSAGEFLVLKKARLHFHVKGSLDRKFVGRSSVFLVLVREKVKL